METTENVLKLCKPCIKKLCSDCHSKVGAHFTKALIQHDESKSNECGENSRMADNLSDGDIELQFGEIIVIFNQNSNE